MKRFFLIMMVMVALASCSGKTESSVSDKDTISGKRVSEQATQFKTLNLEEDWEENPFTFFKGQGLLLGGRRQG